jgi:hypothetical protein
VSEELLAGMERIPDPAAPVARLPAPPAELPSEPSPTRAERARLVRALLVVAALWVAAVAAGIGLRRDLAALPALGPILVWTAMISAGLALVMRPRDRGLPAPVRAVQLALAATPALFAAVALVAGTPAERLSWANVAPCLAISNLVALGPLAAAALVLRRSLLAASAWRGAAVGALAGLSGSVGVHAHCPVGALDHLLAAHGPAIAVGALAGAIFGHRWGRA